jgi:UDP-N-acetylglucosamine acyltransferase
LNTTGIKRRGHSAAVINSLHGAFHLLLSSKLNTSQALEKIKEEIKDSQEVDALVEFIESSKRGVTK